jgi:DNA-binding transcriptional LysR family regulator
VADSLVIYERLEAGTLDVALSCTAPDFKHSNIHLLRLCEKVGSLILPAEHPYSRFAEVPVSALAGLDVVLSPGSDCPDLVNTLKRQMEAMGMRPQRGAEVARSTLIHQARRLGMAVMVARPVEGRPFLHHVSVLYNPFRRSPAAHRFLRAARQAASPSPRARPHHQAA